MAFNYVNYPAGNRANQYSYCDVSQLSTDVATAVAGSELDCRGCRNVSYTFSAATNNLTVSIFVANRSDFTDEVSWNTTNPGAITVGTPEGWAGTTTSNAPVNAAFAFCRVKVVASSAGNQGTLTVVGYAQ